MHPRSGVERVLTTTTVALTATGVAALSTLLVTTLAPTVAAIAPAIAATSATEATASTAASKATASSSTLGSLVDTDGAAIELDIVHGVDSSISIGLLTVADESESTRATCIAVLAWHTDENALRQKFEEFGAVEEAVSSSHPFITPWPPRSPP